MSDNKEISVVVTPEKITDLATMLTRLVYVQTVERGHLVVKEIEEKITEWVENNRCVKENIESGLSDLLNRSTDDETYSLAKHIDCFGEGTLEGIILAIKDWIKLTSNKSLLDCQRCPLLHRINDDMYHSLAKHIHIFGNESAAEIEESIKSWKRTYNFMTNLDIDPHWEEAPKKAVSCQIIPVWFDGNGKELANEQGFCYGRYDR